MQQGACCQDFICVCAPLHFKDLLLTETVEQVHKCCRYDSVLLMTKQCSSEKSLPPVVSAHLSFKWYAMTNIALCYSYSYLSLLLCYCRA